VAHEVVGSTTIAKFLMLSDRPRKYQLNDNELHVRSMGIPEKKKRRKGKIGI
jgi:hypothetical protein